MYTYFERNLTQLVSGSQKDTFFKTLGGDAVREAALATSRPRRNVGIRGRFAFGAGFDREQH